MSATDNWKPAYDAKLNYDGDPRPASSVKYSANAEAFETTNTEGEGDYEFGSGVRQRKLSWTEPHKEGGEALAEGVLVDASYTDKIKTYSGKVRITDVTHNGGGKGGYTIDYQASFTGAVTVAAYTPPGP